MYVPLTSCMYHRFIHSFNYAAPCKVLAGAAQWHRHFAKHLKDL